MKQILILVLTFSSLSFISAQTIDAEKSVVNFKTTALMVNTVNGTFKGMNGEIQFDENNLSGSTFNVCIDPSSINTENQKRDNHLKSEDFFEIAKFLEICFVSTSIEKTKNGFKTTGNLTMHGITKEFEIPFTFENNTFTGSFKIKRLKYNIGEDYGNFTASKEAEIEIVCVLK
jgi:polyisoprenoid-binding protein YceI